MPMGLVLYSGCMIPVLPERTASSLSLVVLLRRAPSDEWHTTRDLRTAGISDEQMHVVLGDHVEVTM